MEYLKKVRLSPFPASFSGLVRSSIKTLSFPCIKGKQGIAPLGLPPVLFIPYVFSSFTSLVLLLLSLLDLGYLSLWLIPPLSLFTLLSHAAFPILARTPRTQAAPSYFSTIIVCVYILATAWFIAFIAVLVIAAIKDRWKWNLKMIEDSGGAATMGTQVAQIVLSCLEVGLLVTFTVKAHRRIIDNGEPESWRPPAPEEDKTIIGLSTVMFDSGEGGHQENGDMQQVRSSLADC